jgi:hypothetical protein
MRRALRVCVGTCFAILVSACGGGNNSAAPASANFDLRTGIAKMVTNGLKADVTFSGTLSTNGVSSAFTGTGTYTRSPAVSVTFDGTAALSQSTTVAGSITTAGQTGSYATSITDYYASTDSAFLGEVSGTEYDVAQAPIAFPTMVVGGSSAILGTISRYTDSSMSVSRGTAQLSYQVMAPADPGNPVSVVVTTKIYDTQNVLQETDVTTYSMTSNSVILLNSSSTQNHSGTLIVTAH